MKTVFKETYALRPETVDTASEVFAETLAKAGLSDKKEILRLRLSLEEILLNWMETDAGEEVRMEMIQRGRRKLSVSLEMKCRDGVSRDPMKTDEEFGSSDLAGNILSNLGAVWSYHYAEGISGVSIDISLKKSSQLVSMLTAIGLALISGFLLRLLPEAVSSGALVYVVNPVFDTFMGFLSAMVAPMMFLSVVWGVFSMGNPRQLGTVGKHVCIRYLLHDLWAALLGAAAVALFFPFRLVGESGGQTQLQAMIEMLFDIIPDNIITPFTTGNTMQIIFLAVVVGISMVVLYKQVPVAAQFVEQCNMVVQQIISVVGRGVPAFVYLSILRLILMDQLGGLSGFAKMILVYIGCTVLLIAGCLLPLWRKQHLSMSLLVKKVLPVYMLTLTTASSSIAFPEASKACEEKLGIHRRLVDFGLPLGIVILMPDFALWMVLLVGAAAEYCGMVLDPASLVMLVVLSVFLAVATPPVPGGGLTCYTILFMQMNIPLELIAIAGALNMVSDFIGTAGHLLAVQTELAMAAGELNMLDEEMLKREA